MRPLAYILLENATYTWKNTYDKCFILTWLSSKIYQGEIRPTEPVQSLSCTIVVLLAAFDNICAPSRGQPLPLRSNAVFKVSIHSLSTNYAQKSDGWCTDVVYLCVKLSSNLAGHALDKAASHKHHFPLLRDNNTCIIVFRVK